MARWRASAGWESFRGTIHGGVICAVLDEAMSRAIVSVGYLAVTAEIRVRFRDKAVPGEELSIRGWVTGVRKRKIEAESSLLAADGVEKAHAWATFLTVRSV
jgi:acyl-coenzyme A thioesterase PaaI-like protein